MRGITICFFVATIFILSCREEKPNPYSQINIYNCHNSINWDSLKINNFLIGQWDWKYSICELGESSSQYADLSINFKDDGTLLYTTNETIDTLKWHLKPDQSYFELELDTFKSPLIGLILICDNILYLNAGPWDGCANIFERNE